ncbi:hypothetical protein GGR01_003552 [Acetobacter oeni]|nr:hypothetical protein [Acetobacter oeni]
MDVSTLKKLLAKTRDAQFAVGSRDLSDYGAGLFTAIGRPIHRHGTGDLAVCVTPSERRHGTGAIARVGRRTTPVRLSAPSRDDCNAVTASST